MVRGFSACFWFCNAISCVLPLSWSASAPVCTRDVFYVRREVDLMKTAKVNAYIMHIFEKD